jgi:hypothetical protein
MNCQLQVLTSEESFQFIFITVLQGVNPRDSNKLLRVLEDLPLRFSLVHQLGWLPDGFENIYFSKLEMHAHSLLFVNVAFTRGALEGPSRSTTFKPLLVISGVFSLRNL